MKKNSAQFSAAEDRSVESPPDSGVLMESLRLLSATSLELLRNRIELIVVEWLEEKERGKEILLLGVLGAVLLLIALLLIALFVVVLFWESYRLAAIGGMTLLYLSAGFFLLLRLRKKLRASPVPFAATLEEFASDLKILK